jgi:hypothetical protein
MGSGFEASSRDTPIKSRDFIMIRRVYQKFRDSTCVPVVLAFLGWIFYFIQSWIYAHIQTSLLDEGGYLYIGELYARGVIRPFQDFGPIRLYTPLAYLIPGQVEAWFGAGLRTGRFFSIFCGMLMIAALWVTARRLGGRWWAAATVWGIALTPISIQIYSLAISEALVACLLACSLAFVLGDRRPLWQLVTGSLLAGTVVMTRQNLVPLIPLLVAYIFWQHGKKAGWWALAGCLFPIIIIHAVYWPNILELWALWLPARLTPFLDPFRFPTAGIETANAISFSGRLLAFLQGIRFHYFTMVGFFVSLFLWPRHNEWNNQTNRRAGYFLAVLFLTLALLHAWATFILTNPSVNCTFCFTPYLSFFDFVVFLLIIVSASSWKKKVSLIMRVVIIIFILVLFPGLGYAMFDRLGPWLLNFKFPAITRGLDPHQWTPFITLWDILSNKFHQDYWISRVPVSIIAGFISGILLLIFGKLLYNRLLKRQNNTGYSFSAYILFILLGGGILLSLLMGGTNRDKGICQADIIQTYEQIGNTLSNIIPANSLVYWGGRTAIPLLYIPTAKIYYPQIYSGSYFRVGGNSEQLLKHGFWNNELARQWQSEAEFIVTESTWPQQQDYHQEFDLTEFEEFRTVPSNPCDPSSYLLIYSRLP